LIGRSISPRPLFIRTSILKHDLSYIYLSGARQDLDLLDQGSVAATMPG
jgi:hypothetical protein